MRKKGSNFDDRDQRELKYGFGNFCPLCGDGPIPDFQIFCCSCTNSINDTEQWISTAYIKSKKKRDKKNALRAPSDK